MIYVRHLFFKTLKKSLTCNFPVMPQEGGVDHYMEAANRTHLPVLMRDEAFLGFDTKRIRIADGDDWSINCFH